MTDDLTPEQKKASLQRLATLQRLRDEATHGNRSATLESIDKLIEMELRILRAGAQQDED